MATTTIQQQQQQQQKLIGCSLSAPPPTDSKQDEAASNSSRPATATTADSQQQQQQFLEQDNSSSNCSTHSNGSLSLPSKRLNLILPAGSAPSKTAGGAATLNTPNISIGPGGASSNQQLLIDSLAQQLASSAGSYEAGQAPVSLFTGLPSCTPASAERLAASGAINPFFWNLATGGDQQQGNRSLERQQAAGQAPFKGKLSPLASALSPMILSPHGVLGLSPEQEAWLLLSLSPTSTGQPQVAAAAGQQPGQQAGQQPPTVQSQRHAQDLTGCQPPLGMASYASPCTSNPAQPQHQQQYHQIDASGYNNHQFFQQAQISASGANQAPNRGTSGQPVQFQSSVRQQQQQQQPHLAPNYAPVNYANIVSHHQQQQQQPHQGQVYAVTNQQHQLLPADVQQQQQQPQFGVYAGQPQLVVTGCEQHDQQQPIDTRLQTNNYILISGQRATSDQLQHQIRPVAEAQKQSFSGSTSTISRQQQQQQASELTAAASALSIVSPASSLSPSPAQSRPGSACKQVAATTNLSETTSLVGAKKPNSTQNESPRPSALVSSSCQPQDSSTSGHNQTTEGKHLRQAPRANASKQAKALKQSMNSDQTSTTTTTTTRMATDPADGELIVKKKSRGGRKKKLVTHEEMIARKNRSKERNRVAAKRCRQKRKQFLDELRDKIDELSELNQRLQKENSLMKTELETLKQHHNACRP